MSQNISQKLEPAFGRSHSFCSMPTHADQHLHLRMTPKHAPVHIIFLVKVLGAHITHELLSDICDLQGRWHCTPKISRFSTAWGRAGTSGFGTGIGGGNTLNPVLQPEIYDIATSSWSGPKAAASNPRLYHSTAILLPSGEVLSCMHAFCDQTCLCLHTGMVDPSPSAPCSNSSNLALSYIFG